MEGIIRHLSVGRDDVQEYWGQELYKWFQKVVQKNRLEKRSWFGQLLIVRDVKDTERKSRRVARSQKDLLCKETQNVL